MRGADEPLFLARDVYPTWRRHVRAAQVQVVVFSPYLDRLAVALLDQCPLSREQIRVVTDLSPLSGNLNYRGQLLAIKRLLNQGVEVRSLARLHAKVLLVDGRTVTVGSQNFTSYARLSKEATVDARADLEGTAFVRQLLAWQSEAEPVGLQLIERLLAHLEDELEAFANAHVRLVKAAEAELALARVQQRQVRLQRERAAALKVGISERLRTAVSRTHFRAPQQAVYGRLKSVWSDASSSWYHTLEAHKDMDFTYWIDTRTTPWAPRRLTRLNFYPMILRPSGRMAYARIGHMRITNLWTGVRRRRLVDGRWLWANVHFPAAPTDGANIVLTLRPTENATYGCRIAFLYDGTDLTYISDEAFGGSGDLFYRLCMEMLEKDREPLLSLIFDDFDPQRVGVKERHAEDYFPRSDYRLDLVMHGPHEVLIATPV